MDENQAQMETPSVGGTPAQAPQPELTVTDLNNIRSVLDLAIRRGTFGGSEISSVGAVFDRLNAFLNAIAAPQDSANQPQ
jgi:hypothetical protein